MATTPWSWPLTVEFTESNQRSREHVHRAGVLDGTFFLTFKFRTYTPRSLLALHLGLALVKRNIPLDLVHARQGIGVVPGGVFDFSLVGRHGVVGRVAFVGAMRRGGGRAEVRLGDGVGWELGCVG
jgi:hypothetical protein